MKPPSICAAIIGRNESRDLPRLLKSLAGVADEIVYVDTGSTDNTVAIAEADERVTVINTRGASEPNPDKSGEWRLVNFALARNIALALAESSGCSHVLWMDCDDEVVTPLAIRRAAYLPDCCYGIWIELGNGVRQVHYRLYPAKWKLRFKGWVHEWLDMGTHPQAVLNDACIRHDATPHESAGEDSNARNLRILTAQYTAEPDARTAFYLANTHKDGGRWASAALWYRIRLGYGDAFRDEYLFALLYLGRSLRAAGDLDGALAVCSEGLALAPDWQEFRMDIAFVHYQAKRYTVAIDEAMRALNKPIPETILWREPSMYRDQPARLISWCHEHLGNLAQSLAWSQEATRLIGHPDEDWAKREAVLEQRQAPGAQIIEQTVFGILKGLRPKIALHRPGAIGDILMTLNLIPAFKEANPDADVHYFCHAALGKPDALGSIMLAAGVDMVMDAATLPHWRGQYERVIDLIGYPIADGYPERPMRRHLLDYFAEELGVPLGPEWDHKGLPALTLQRPHRDQKRTVPYVTVQTKAGWSAWKEWPHWQEVIERLWTRIDFVRIDESEGRTLSESIALFANAQMHIGIDSFCNHLSNFYWQDDRGNGRRVPALILWGSTQPSAAGYQDNINIVRQPPCGPCFREDARISRMPRGVCITPERKPDGSAREYGDGLHQCMANITVEEVLEQTRMLWERVSSAEARAPEHSGS